MPPTNEDLATWEVVPYGKFGAGVWNGNTAGLITVIGILIVGLVGLPEWRYFFGATVPAGSVVAYVLWRRHSQLQASRLFLQNDTPASAWQNTERWIRG